MLRRSCFVAVVALVLTISNLTAQSTNATITGRITDQSKAAIAGARVLATNVDTGIQRFVSTGAEGTYGIGTLIPGTYKLEVEKSGFKTIIKPDLVLHVQDVASLNFEMAIGATSESVTVQGQSPLINTTDGSVSTVVDRNLAENLPMNGRSFQTLIQLTPGVVLTASNPSDNGQFSVNGQRSASNYWMIDGVSANIGVGVGSAGNGLAGASAGFSVLGGTNSLVSVDAMQEFRIQTSTFAPEFGRAPGGQISIITRSGTNQWHGSAFNFLRNDALDANNWFGDLNHLAKPEERQNDFGATFGGPIRKDRTFFFFSYEGLRLRLPQVAVELVPDLQARQTAIPPMRPYLSAFPLPSPNTQDDVVNEVGQFKASYSSKASLDAYSIRLDHRVNDKISIFGRYNYSPSTLAQRGSGTLNSVTPSEVNVQTATVGVTWAISEAAVNDLHFNYSRTDSRSYTYLDGFGGGIALPSLPFPSGFNSGNAQLELIWDPLFPFGGLDLGLLGHNAQRQSNLVENFSMQKASHTLKLGVDFRRLTPTFANFGYFQAAEFGDVPSSTLGNPLYAQTQSGRSGAFFFHNLGIFGQDTWRMRRDLTVTFGLRWDVDVAPSSNPSLLSVTGFDLRNLSNLAIAPSGTPAYHTTYGNLAPRIGVAYQVPGSKEWQRIVHAGFGLFYDLASSEVGNSINRGSYPFGAGAFFPVATFPLDSTQAVPPAITPTALQTVGTAGLFDPHLKLPYTVEWNVSLQQAMGIHQTFSASYVGSSGRRLIQTAQVRSVNPDFAFVHLITGVASSDYEALQLQFERRIFDGLQALTSYTWSHSIDTASAGSVTGNTSNALLPADINQNRGPSDFDVRNAFSLGATYDIYAPQKTAFSRAVLHGWSVENVFQVHSAPPLTVFDGHFRTFMNNTALIRPDVIVGQSFYLYGSQYPGGKALNLSAFTDPPLNSQGVPTREGSLGRNALRGFGAWQWDLGVHRDFPIGDYFKLQFRAEIFNVLNHPNFGPPISNITNKNQFGLSTQTLASYLSGTSLGNGALSPLYQIGGPRSTQFALKLQF